MTSIDQAAKQHGVTPGVLNGAARSLFIHGACSALAIALHDATGWDILAVTDAHNVYDDRAGGGSAMHWGVRHPSGKFLDIEGLHDDADLVDQYRFAADDDEADIAPAARVDALEWHGNGSISSTVPLDLAVSFVGPLLKSLDDTKR